MSEYAVIAFSKEPKPGTVKTRLTPEIPPEGAAYLYEALLWDTIDILIALKEAEKYLFFTPDNSKYFSDLTRSGFRVLPQGKGDLGEKMWRATSTVLEETGLPVIITGTDCPTISAETFKTAYALLDTHDAVVGPSEDGGYYLIGLRKRTKAPFVDIPWSTDSVLEETLLSLEREGLKVATMEKLFDIDRAVDVARFGKLLEENELPEEFSRRRFARAARKLYPHLLRLLNGR